MKQMIKQLTQSEEGTEKKRNIFNPFFISFHGSDENSNSGQFTFPSLNWLTKVKLTKNFIFKITLKLLEKDKMLNKMYRRVEMSKTVEYTGTSSLK